jgi:glycosyltransferase involved in cell wall biosynthesis
MRIVAVQTGLEADSVLGGEITDREFLLRLADRGVEIHVLATAGHPTVVHPNLVPHYYRRGFYRKMPYSANLDAARELRRLLANLGQVDWIRFNSPYSVGVGTACVARGYRLWGSYLHCEDYRHWKWVDSWLPLRCDLVTCLSEDTRRDLIARCPAADGAKTVVVPVGIDLERLNAAGRSREAVRAELGVSDQEVLVLFVGVAIPRKGIADLVAAWRRLGPRGDVRLLLVSKPVAARESQLIAELAREDARVMHLSKVPYERIAEYFRASDIFFFPTHREGFGIVVGEAMACGLPVLTTRARGVRSVAEEGQTALMADVGDVEGLARQLHRLVEDPDLRRCLGDAGRERVATVFGWDAIMENLMALLQQGQSKGRAA